MEILKFFLGEILVKIIKLYQKTLSPDHGLLKHRHPFGYCRFQPTCSEYSIQAIRKYGPIKGLIKTIWRLLRCNPFNKGGYDPV
jgi:putative membrane protein insertion efficiency factor